MVGQTSPVWLFFRKIDNNIVQCVVRNKKNNECGAKISRSTHSSTSALIKHLKSHHREQHAEIQKLRKVDKIPREQPALHAAMSTGTGSPIPSTSQSQGITSFETFSAFLRHLQPLNACSRLQTTQSLMIEIA